VDQSSTLPHAAEAISPAIVYTHRGFDVGDDGLDPTISPQTIARSKSQPNPHHLREPNIPSTSYSPFFNLAWFPWESLPPPNWLQDEKEVHILKHYIDVLSTWV
jgi:hypothetical protein